MEDLKENFMRMQIFENHDQYKKFQKEVVQNVEKYEEKILKKENVTQYYAWIQFDFPNYIPLNIFLNGMDNKYLEVKNIQVKKIIIAILEHFLLLRINSLEHGNIKPENIILQFSDSNFEFKQLYFTNYLFQNNEKDEQNIKIVVQNLWNQIFKQDQNSDQFKYKKIKDILDDIQYREVEEGKSQWIAQIKSWNPFGQYAKIKNLAQKIKLPLQDLKGEMRAKIIDFMDKEIQSQNNEDYCNSNCQEQPQKTEEENSSIKYEVCSTDNSYLQEKKQGNEQDERGYKEQQWLKLIKDSQERFLGQLQDILLQNFVEKVTSEFFDPKVIEQKNDKYKEDQAQKGNKDLKINKEVDLDFIMEKHQNDANVILELLLKIFKGIQTTFLKEWQSISDNYYKDYKFDFDLEFSDLVEQHFNEFLIIIFKYSFVKKDIFNHTPAKEQELIAQQFRENYDEWISYKILDLINNLI